MRRVSVFFVILALHVAATSEPASAAVGIRAGFTDGPGDAYVGVELETTVEIGSATFAPSVDLEIGDADAISFNGDLRWDLLPVPDTGAQIFGKAGPVLLLTDENDEIGFSLTAGAELGLSKGRRLQLEIRFGFADVQDLKVGGTLMF